VLFVQCKKISGEHLYPELDATNVPMTWLSIAEWLTRNVSSKLLLWLCYLLMSLILSSTPKCVSYVAMLASTFC